MDIDEVFSKKNIGIPVKVRMGRVNGDVLYYYGRYYGRGHDGESTIEDNDHCLLSVITPGGSLIYGGFINFEIIKEKDELDKLEYFESLEENPYESYLSRDDNGNYYKNYLYKYEEITFSHNTNEWFEKNGYFDIDAKVFGETLACIASKELGIQYRYQEKIVCYRFPKVYGHKEQDIYQKYIGFLSPVEYDEYYMNWNSTYPFESREGYFIISPFDKYPILMPENEIALFSRDKLYTNKQIQLSIKLGHLDKNDFKPNQFRFIHGINHNNDKNDFIEKFVLAIINYKLQNRKPQLLEEDMEIILRSFGIKREEQIKKLTLVLNNIKSSAIEVLSAKNEVGIVLEKRRK